MGIQTNCRLSAVIKSYGTTSRMATPSSPEMSGGGYSPINRSPGTDVISSGLLVHDDKRYKSAQVAAVMGYDRTKSSREGQRDLALSSSPEAGSRHSGRVLAASGIPILKSLATSRGWRGGGGSSSAVNPSLVVVAQGGGISIRFVLSQNPASDHR